MAGYFNFYNAIKQNYKQQNDEALAQITPLLNGLVSKRIFDIEKQKEAQKGIAEQKAIAGAKGLKDTSLPPEIQTPAGAAAIYNWKEQQGAIKEKIDAYGLAFGIDMNPIKDKNPSEQAIYIDAKIAEKKREAEFSNKQKEAVWEFENVTKPKMLLEHSLRMSEKTVSGGGGSGLTDTQKNAASAAQETYQALSTTGKTYTTADKKNTYLVKVGKSTQLGKEISYATISGKEYAFDGSQYYTYNKDKWMPAKKPTSKQTVPLTNAYSDWFKANRALGTQTAQPQAQTAAPRKKYNAAKGTFE